jgi:sodium/potassium-transporting ATPase subunit alpha
LDGNTSEAIATIQEDFSRSGQRVLLLAKRIITSKDKEEIMDLTQLENHLEALIDNLIVVGLVALVDPPRHDTAETVRVCRAAGIRFVMVTGKAAVLYASCCSQW